MEEKDLQEQMEEQLPQQMEELSELTEQLSAEGEFDLEDILKEFGDEQEEIPEKTPEEILEQVEQEVLQEHQAEQEEEPAQEAPRVVSGDTIRLDIVPEMKGNVTNAQHIDDEEEAPVIPVTEEKAEPFSEEWEPEYEQPIAEYIPQKPIIFRPRSRLRELKAKLVAGPEKMYYALSEMGLGKLQFVIFASVLVVLLSAGATTLYALGLVPDNRIRLMVFGQFLAMMISALLGSNQLLAGAASLLHRKFSLNTLLLFSFVLCCVDGVMGLQQLRVPCCAAFSLQVTMSLWSTYQRRNTRLGQLDTMRKAIRLDSICAVEDYYEGKKGLLRGEGQVEDFMDTLDEPARPDTVLSVYAMVALCISIAFGVGAAVLHSISFGIQVAAVSVLAAMPASAFVTTSRPMAVLERRLHSLGTVLCGWKGVKGLSGKAAFPLDHDDLFPGGTVRMNGVKFFGNREPDQIIAYASALVSTDGGALEPLFTQLLDSRNGMHYPVTEFRSYEHGGIGGQVNGEPVLVGTLSFLKEMGVELPEGLRISHAVCASVDGELCGLFALNYQKERGSIAGLVTLSSYRGLFPVLTGGDFMLTDGFIRKFFDVKTKRIRFPEQEVRQQLREVKPEEGTPALALITGEGLAPFAYAVTGARALKSACKAGVVIHMVGGILGLVMMGVLAFLGAAEYLTPANMFLYQLLWMIPGLLVTAWTRTI